MKPAGVFYATRHGQTRKIAEHLADQLRARGLEVDVTNIGEETPRAPLTDYSAAILAASLYMGHHEREMVHFVRDHLAELEQVPTTFLSVSMSEASAEDDTRAAAVRDRAAGDVRRAVDQFIERTGWQPSNIRPVAGALAYTDYNPLVRFIMKRIARSSGGATDTSRDHEYTDWPDLDRLAGEIADQIATNSHA
jgi:menaquinone-dependent protoporphyrinogen oxidase